MSGRLAAATSLLVNSAGRPSTQTLWSAGGWVTQRADTATFAPIFRVEASGNGFELRFKENGTTLNVANSSGASSDLMTPGVDVPVFYMCVCSGGGTGQVAVYLRRLTDSSFTTATYQITNNTFTEWAYGGPTWGSRLNGRLDNLMLWDRALTADEVERQFHQRLPVAPNDLRHWFPTVADTTAGVILDRAGGGATLTVSGSALSIEDGVPRVWGGTSVFPNNSTTIVGTSATTFAGMTSAGTGTVDVVGTSATTFAGMTSAGTGAVDVVGTSATTFAGMASFGTIGAATISGTGATTFAGMTSAATAAAKVAGVSVFTFVGMTSGGVIVVTAAPSPEPAPEPSPPPTSTNFAYSASSRRRVGIRVDGKYYSVTYQEAAEILARQADADAREQRAQKSRKAAKTAARSSVQGLKARLTIEQPLVFDGIDMSVVADRMFRDLRDVYSRQLIESLLQSNHARKQADDQAAMAAAELLLMYGD